MTDKEKIYMDVCDPADKECVSYALSDVTFTGYFYPGSNPASMCKIRLSWCDDIMQTPIVSSVEILRDTDVWETITDDVEHDYLLDNLWPWIQDIRDSFNNQKPVTQIAVKKQAVKKIFLDREHLTSTMTGT